VIAFECKCNTVAWTFAYAYTMLWDAQLPVWAGPPSGLQRFTWLFRLACCHGQHAAGRALCYTLQQLTQSASQCVPFPVLSSYSFTHSGEAVSLLHQHVSPIPGQDEGTSGCIQQVSLKHDITKLQKAYNHGFSGWLFALVNTVTH